MKDFSRGRRFDEVPDIVARICGICPFSHMSTAIRALEKALDITPSPEIVRLRKIMTLSQIVSSHLIHLCMLAMPDYFKLHSVVDMLPRLGSEIQRLLKMKEVMNNITAQFGGRALHPVAMAVGGFTGFPPGDAKNILQSYGRICNALLQGLKQLGIQGTYAPINDILVDGKKISGNAQTRKANTVLQHGTILLDVDVDTMFSLLTVPNEKIKDKLIRDVKQRVTSIEHVAGKRIPFEEVADALTVGFEKEFHIELVQGILSKEEKTLALQFEKECFSTTEWNHRR